MTGIHCPSVPLMKEFFPQLPGILIAESLHPIVFSGLLPLGRALCPNSCPFLWCPTSMSDQYGNIEAWASQLNSHGFLASETLGIWPRLLLSMQVAQLLSLANISSLVSIPQILTQRNTLISIFHTNLYNSRYKEWSGKVGAKTVARLLSLIERKASHQWQEKFT